MGYLPYLFTGGMGVPIQNKFTHRLAKVAAMQQSCWRICYGIQRLRTFPFYLEIDLTTKLSTAETTQSKMLQV